MVVLWEQRWCDQHIYGDGGVEECSEPNAPRLVGTRGNGLGQAMNQVMTCQLIHALEGDLKGIKDNDSCRGGPLSLDVDDIDQKSGGLDGFFGQKK